MYSNFVLNFDFIKSWKLKNLLYSPAIERNTILTLSLMTEIRQLAALIISYINLRMLLFTYFCFVILYAGRVQMLAK